MINFKTTLQVGGIAKLIKTSIEGGQKELDSQVLKDSNFYAPHDQGDLIESGVRNSKPGDGKIMWSTPYSRRLYYNPQYNFSKDRNPNASGLWFENAKSMHLPSWLKISQDAIRRGL
ncbi:minor capsid protein [Thalassobacillus sp. C254]|uniref:minor capsid protein n=1 Tax=Thalassobacillus sp. C254 TaxID=1225341 RepID=UPI0006D112BA|nr:minor capsid protein [Thalassobacillus sp. C254]